ncbi:MAG: DsbA family protein [Actinomycetota bacterium]|nr:DsbA family protein [Actinomycetota bacterium]
MARARVARLQKRHDVELKWMPFELHPEIPDGGNPNTRRFSQIAPLAEAEGIAFEPPSVFRPTRRAHQAAMLVEHVDPAAAPDFHDRLYAAYWEAELDVEDPEVLCALAAGASVEPHLIAETVESGGLLPALGASMMRANEWGVTGTPAYVVDNKLHVPGLQEDEFWDRIIPRLQARQ